MAEQKSVAPVTRCVTCGRSITCMPRLIYSLIYTLELPDQALAELVVPLTPDGQSPTIKSASPEKRVIDLRPGDWFQHPVTGRRKIKAIRAFREAQLGVDRARHLNEGYLVRST